jgi:hypothetical protein
MIRKLSTVREQTEPVTGLGSCEHRTVSKDGHIICAEITEGENTVSSDGCRTCPVQAVNCTHLRFSLRQSSPRPLIVRYNGRTEVWDDEPAEVHFEQAACAAQVMPIEHPQVCRLCIAATDPCRRRAAPPASQAPGDRWRQSGALSRPSGDGTHGLTHSCRKRGIRCIGDRCAKCCTFRRTG